MGLSLAKVGDVGVGTCSCHESAIEMTGIIVTGSGNIFCNGLPVSGLSGIVLGSCGHTGVIISGSSSVNINSKGATRVSDSFTGCFSGIIASGSGNTSSG